MIPATPLPTRTLRRAVVAGAERNQLTLDQVTPSLAALKAAWDVRRERLTLAPIAVPLAETATGMTGQWWTWPALLAGAAHLLHFGVRVQTVPHRPSQACAKHACRPAIASAAPRTAGQGVGLES